MAQALLEQLSPSIKSLATVVFELRSHVEQSRSQGTALEKDIVLPHFRNLVAIQNEWKATAQLYQNAAAEAYVDNQFAPSVKTLGVKLASSLQDPSNVPDVERELRTYYKCHTQPFRGIMQPHLRSGQRASSCFLAYCSYTCDFACNLSTHKTNCVPSGRSSSGFKFKV